MQVVIIKQPYEVAFSNSPIIFVLGLSPYSTQDRKQDYVLTINIEIEDVKGSNVFNIVKTQNFSPNTSGEVQFNIASIIDPYLEYYTPKPTLNRLIECKSQSLKYRISYSVSNNNLIVVNTQSTSAFTAIKGGLSDDVIDFKQFFADYIVTKKRPLSYFNNQRVFANDIRYFYWLFPAVNNNSQQIELKFYYNDGSNSGYTININLVTTKWAVCCAPMGFNQCDMANKLVGNKTVFDVVKYEVMVRIGNLVFAKNTFVLDHRNFYDTYQILFRNSIGGIDTITLRGQVDFKADYEITQAKKTNIFDNYKNQNLQAQSIVDSVDESISYKADTGFIRKDDIDCCRDLFLNKGIIEIVNNKFYPVVIKSKSTNFYSNKDSLYALQLEWSRGIINKNFTPHNAISYATSCPSLEKLEVTQVNANYLRISYSCPLPYDMVEIWLVQQTNVKPAQIFIGNTGNILFYFGDTIVLPDNIDVKARIICDDTVSPMLKGAITNVNIDLEEKKLPVAIDDLYKIEAGYTAAKQLIGSVMANDYSPDDAPIECVAVTNGTTNAGATYSINSAGIVTYLPIVSGVAFTGKDYFDYQIREVGSSTTVTARCYINVGDETTFVYVKAESNIINSVNLTFKIKFYSDALATQALNVNGLNLIVDYRRVEDNYSVTSTGQILTGTTYTNYSITATGTEMTLFVGSNEIVSFPDLTIISFEVLARSGYQII